MDQRRIGVVIASLAASAAAAAAEPAANAPAPAGQELIEEVTVTGSSIPTTPDQVAVPVTTLTAEQLALGGDTSNALEMLRKAIPAFEGRSNTGNSNANNNNQNTAGGAQLQLRNLPTLVLVNGRRLANSGIGAVNGKNFVDVSQIPAAAIDRVEVLTDGASSIYGSDAIGGVVNFILKSDYDGFKVGAYGGQATDYREGSGFATAGFKLGSISIVSTLSFTHTDPLGQNERPFSNPFVGHAGATTLPGVVSGGNAQLSPTWYSPSQNNPTGLNATAPSLAALIANGTYVTTTPGAISRGFDLAPYQTLLLEKNVGSFSTTIDAPLIEGHRLDAFADVLISQNKSATNWAPASSTVSVPAGAPYNPLTTAFPGVAFADLAIPHSFDDKAVSTRATVGLRGEISPKWTWETAVVYSESDLQQRQSGLIYKPNLALAIAGGYDATGAVVPGGAYSEVYYGYSNTGPKVVVPALDPFATAGLNPATLANLYGTEVINAVSQLESWDGKIVGRAFALPAGDLGVAVGASFRRESLSGRTDPNGRVTDPVTGSYFGNDQQWIGGAFADPFAKNRTITGEFAEVRVPVTSSAWNVPVFHELDLTAAVRAEKYSDAGRSTVPKFGFRWEPFDAQFTLRGNYSKSFVAPALYSEYGPTDTRTSNGPIATAFGAAYAGEPFNAEDGNNPNLQPATSVSKTVGFVFKPTFVKGLMVVADYSDITLSGFQGGAGFNNILTSINALGSASPFFGSLALNGFPGTPGAANPFGAPGSLKAFLTNPVTGQGVPAQAAQLYLVDYFRNLAQLHEESWNVTVDYIVATDSAGTFSLSSNGTIFDSFLFNPGIAGLTSVQGAGASNNASVFGGTLPKYRFYTSFDWAYHDVELTVANTYASGVQDRGGNGTLAPVGVDRYFSWDVRAAYSWHNDSVKNFNFAVGVNNVFDRMPPLDPRVFIDNNADVSTYSPIGRFVYVNFSLGF
jgi:iron complex outermembrane receptor protein